MNLSGYARRELLRNPRRTLASLVGVLVGVGLFSAVLFFIDGSGASMTRRAIAPLTLDIQRVLTAPIGGGMRLAREVNAAALDSGDSTFVTLTVTNEGVAPAHEVAIRDHPSAPLAYVPRSTTFDGQPIDDGDGEIPLSKGNAGTGLNIGTVAPGETHHIVYRVKALSRIPSSAAVPVDSTISTREAFSPAPANAPRPASVTALADKVARTPGVKGADPLVFVDLAAGAISAHGASVPGPAKLFSFDGNYQAHYPSIKILSGRIRPGDVLISAETARALRVGVGDTVTLALPRSKALAVGVSGITDLSGAKPLFESRQSATLERFDYVPYSMVIGLDFYRAQVAPRYAEAVATRDAQTNSFPLEEVDISLDRSSLKSDPATAAAQTLRIAQEVQGVAAGQGFLIDNISNTLQVAKGDAAVAKRMFVFLGLPGALLAAILTAYAGTLLAEAQRRENALLRVRGATQRHLLYLLTLRTVGIAGMGSLIGTALGFASVLTLLGSSILFEASTRALVQSALIGVACGMGVTAAALYLPGRRLITQEIKQELAVIERQASPWWRGTPLNLLALAGAVIAQVVAMRLGAFDVPPGSVYAGQSVSLPLKVLIAPIVGWLAATLLIAHVMQAITARAAASRGTLSFDRLLSGVLWRSITRRLASVTGGAVTVALVVGLGTILACFATVYDQAKVADARFLVGSDIRVTPNPTGSSPHPTGLAGQFRVDGTKGSTAVVYSHENASLSSPFNGDVATLAAIDPAGYGEVAAVQDSIFVGGSARQNMAALQKHPDGVFVNIALAKGLRLRPGDQADVLLGRGTDQQTVRSMKVLGLFTRFPGAPKGTDIVANIAYYQRETGLIAADYYLVSTIDHSPSGPERVTRSLAAVGGFSRSFDVETSGTTFDKEQSSLTGLNVRGLLHLDSFYTFLMAATATAMFVFGLLLQRRREYVTLRAQGLQGREIRRLVLAESGISSMIGAVIGLVVGIGVASQFIRVLAPIFTLPPPLRVPAVQLAILVALVLGATALSSVAAAVIIARLKPTELLRDE